MSNLILDSLIIRNFRTFQSLQIDRLRPVNLIIGKHNVGKTSLLEALWLYVHPSPSLLWDMLEARHEGRRPTVGSEIQIDDQLVAMRNLFYGRPDLITHPQRIQIGSLHAPQALLSMSIECYREDIDAQGRSKLLPLSPDDVTEPHTRVPVLLLQRGNQRRVSYRFRDIWILRATRKTNCIFLPTTGLESWRIPGLWEDIALSGLEDEVLQALTLIVPDIEQVMLSDAPEHMEELNTLVYLRGAPAPVLLNSLGEGVNRVFGIILALVNVKGGLLLIDEIAGNLHHQIHEPLWELIFQLASRLSVQVVATSHNWDCIDAFRRVAHAHRQDQQGILIGLRRTPTQSGSLTSALFDGHDLTTLTREEIELW